MATVAGHNSQFRAQKKPREHSMQNLFPRRNERIRMRPRPAQKPAPLGWGGSGFSRRCVCITGSHREKRARPPKRALHGQKTAIGNSAILVTLLAMPRKPIEIPPEAAKAFVRDLKAF